MIGRTVVFTDGRHEYPALITRARTETLLDLAVLRADGPRAEWYVFYNVPRTDVPQPETPLALPAYLVPNTWRPPS